MYYSAIGLLAALTLFIVNRDILVPGAVYDKPAWGIYRKFLAVVAVYYVTDILWGILEYKKLRSALFIDTTVYFTAVAAGIAFWARYIVAYLNENSSFGRFLIYAGRMIAGVIFALTVVNIFKPVIFTIDSGCVYKAMPVRNVVLVCQILFLIVISLFALTLMYREGAGASNRVRYSIPAAFGIIMAVFLFVQLWYPYLPLYSTAYMLGTSLLHSFIANDEKEEHRRKLDEAGRIAELKDRFVSLLDNIPGMTFTKDAQTGVYLACNQAFAEYAHKDSPEDVAGLTDAEMFDPETAAHFVGADKIALSLSKPYIFYEDVSDAVGNPRQLQTTKLKYTDTSGRACVLGICQDITDLMSIRHEQAMTKEAYESAVKNGLVYTHIAQTLARDYTEMFRVDTDTEEFTEYRRVEDGNTLSQIRSGWHFFSDCKAELSESVFPDDREAFLSALNRKKLMKALGHKDTFVTTCRRVIGDKPVYFSMKISRMENDERSIIVGFTDVDAEMREAIAKNEALNEALTSAKEASNARTSFLSGMSHELRTPINAIIGIDSLALKNSGLDSKTREYLEKIGHSARHLLSVVNDILDMSRIESGWEVLHKNEFSLGAALEQIASKYKAQCAEKGLDFEFDTGSLTDDHYIGDEKKLGKVLDNILSNSVKFTDRHGKVTLTVEKAENTTEPYAPEELRFRVKDTGCGMDKELVSRLLEESAPVNSFVRSGFGGSGLGIAVTKKLVEMMKGSFGIVSEKGAGTEVTVTVPLLRSGSRETDRTGEIDLGSLNILVVDDNPIEAEHAKAVLEEIGIRTDYCTGGQEALRRLEIRHARKQPYTMVLMDWNMPGLNGSETSAEIHRLYKDESLIVAMTAYQWEDIREEANSVGVTDCLEKPLFAANILKEIERIARKSHHVVFKEKKRARLENRRILLAEDMELNAEILTDMLEMENIKADHAVNGKSAVELFENSTEGIYSAILMDVRMPVMDGLEAAKAIRAMDREDAKRIPIIALTANAFDEDVQLSMQAGMNAHLTKPVEADHLIRTLGELIYEAEGVLS